MPTAARLDAAPPRALLTAVSFAAVLACFLLGVILILAINGVITEGNATSFAAVIAAVVAVFGLAFKLMTDELVRDRSEIRSRQALALAIHAEISSNLDQQRRTVEPSDVADLIDRKLRQPAAGEPPAGDARTKGGEHSASLADRKDPIFGTAIARYDLIPAAAIHDVIAYYNLNQMMNDVVVLIGSTGFIALDVDQRRTVLRSYYELAERVDEKACAALNKLADSIDRDRQDRSAPDLVRYATQAIILSADDKVILGWRADGKGLNAKGPSSAEPVE